MSSGSPSLDPCPVVTDSRDDAERVADRWRNRRRMAWWSLVSGLLFPVLLLLSPVACATLSAIAGPFYLFVGAVVGAYIGFATVDDKWQGYGRTQPPSQPVSPRTPGLETAEPYAPAAQSLSEPFAEPFPPIQPIDRRKYDHTLD